MAVLQVAYEFYRRHVLRRRISISWNVKRNNAHRLPSVGVAVLLHDSGLRCKKPCQRGTAAIRSVVLWLSRRLMLAQPCVGQYVARSLGRRVATTRRRCLRSLRMQAINLLIERDSLYTGVGVRRKANPVDGTQCRQRRPGDERSLSLVTAGSFP